MEYYLIGDKYENFWSGREDNFDETNPEVLTNKEFAYKKAKELKDTYFKDSDLEILVYTINPIVTKEPSNESNITCPYCKYEFDGLDFVDTGDMEGEFDVDCENEECGRKMRVEFNTDITFKSFKIKE